MNKAAILFLSALTVVGCARSGPPAPVDLRGVGAGSTSPNMVSSSGGRGVDASNLVGSGSYTPPPGYGKGGIQAETLGEPNDGYSAAAQKPLPPTPAQDMSQPVPPAQGGAYVPPAQGGGLAPPPAQPAVASAPTGTQGSGTFGWPLRGKILSEYGQKPGGQANDGLNIAAAKGTPVYASKDGTVAYAGNELRSFGNMVLVKHTGGQFTVYAHLDQINVSKGAQISKGQPVGTVGQSGGVSEPQLHFEVREGSSPKDPRKYLGD